MNWTGEDFLLLIPMAVLLLAGLVAVVWMLCLTRAPKHLRDEHEQGGIGS